MIATLSTFQLYVAVGVAVLPIAVAVITRRARWGLVVAAAGLLVPVAGVTVDDSSWGRVVVIGAAGGLISWLIVAFPTILDYLAKLLRELGEIVRQR